MFCRSAILKYILENSAVFKIKTINSYGGVMKAIISLSGSLLSKDGEINVEYCKKFAELVKNKEVGVVVGGGGMAKKYVEAIKKSKNSEFLADRAAILITKANAMLIQTALGERAFPKIIENFDDAALAFEEGKIAVGAGTIEGITTDTDAVLMAERVEAKKIVNAGKIDGIYSEDPEKNKNAKKFRELSFREFLELAEKNDKRNAKVSFPFDLVAAKLAARSGIEIWFVDGRNLGEIEKALKGEKIKGTIVR